MNKRIASVRSTYNTQKCMVPYQSFPDIFFFNAKMSSLPPVSTIPDVSFASALKSGTEGPASTTEFLKALQPRAEPDNLQQPTSAIEKIMLSFQARMTEFMSFMRGTMQDLTRALVHLASQHSK